MTFLTQHRGQAIPSPTLLQKMTDAFVQATRAFAAAQPIPLLHFERGVRKEAVAAEQRARFTGTDGVVFIGVAQEKAHAFRASKRTDGPLVGFQYSRQPVYVNYYYFYLLDDDFGPAFIKVCSYAPFTLKVCLNGHEWAKRQLAKAGIAFEALDNGFRACADPARLQALCDALGAAQIQAFFAKWLARLPLPLDRGRPARRLRLPAVGVAGRGQPHPGLRRARARAGPSSRRSSARTSTWAGPTASSWSSSGASRRTRRGWRARACSRRASRPACTSSTSTATSSSTSRRAARCAPRRRSTTRPTWGWARTSATCPTCSALGREVNRRLLAVQRLSQACTLSPASVDRVVLPTVTDDGQRAPGLRFGDRRVMALLSALILFVHLPAGLTHRALRRRVADLHLVSTSPPTRPGR